MASINIGEYETQFKPYSQFMRVHRSHLVHLKYVDSFVRSDGGYLKMYDGTLISVSRKFRDELLERIKYI